jgi:hypothetical protein
MRSVLVAGLILAAGLAALGVRGEDPSPPALPPVQSLLAATGWQVESASEPLALAMRSQQWLLSDGAGHQALLYVGATARARTMLQWSAELGYQGAGYVEQARSEVPLTLADGRRVAVGEASMRHVADGRVLDSAVAGPSGVGRDGRDLLLPAAWDLVRGRSATYYVVRVSMPVGDGAPERGRGLLAAVLSRLAPG